MPEELHVRLSSSYQLKTLGRLLRDLRPLVSLHEPAVTNLDLSGLVWMGPTAIALTTAVARKVGDDDLYLDGSRLTLPKSRSPRIYLERMDFLKGIFGHDLDRPEDFTRHAAVGFRPCSTFDSDDNYPGVASELTAAICETCETDDAARNSIRVCLDELCENVLHHADSGVGGFAAAQGWPKKHLMEVGIVDLGQGILQSLTKNPDHADIQDDVTAINTALRVGVTATPDRNAGLGLAITRLLLHANGGRLLVRSGAAAVYSGTDPGSEVLDAHFPGTIIALQARSDRPLNINAVYASLDKLAEESVDSEAG